MTATDDRERAAVARLLEWILATDLPAGLRERHPSGVDVAALDADLAGCAVAWLCGRGRLDEERGRTLRARTADLGTVTDGIATAAERHYVRRLRELAALLAREPGPGAGG